MIASARKIKRTKNEQLRQVESLNANHIKYFYDLFLQFKTVLDQLIPAVTNLQVVVGLLKKKGLINDLEIGLEMTRIQELEEMAKKATIIDPNRKEKEDEKKSVNP
jgi:hypothetical protein